MRSDSSKSTDVAVARVIRPGLLTTIQDLGRWGWQRFGVPTAGPMDHRSHRLSNALAGNGVDAAALEVTLVGPEMEFEDDRRLAVAGAVFELTVDGQRVPDHAPFEVQRGTRLRFGRRIRGSRAYVAIAGGIAVPPVLGSRSTHLVSKMGGLNGRALVAGDLLPLGPYDPHAKRPREASGAQVPALMLSDSPPVRVRVLAGPQQDLFANEALDVLQSEPYVVRKDSDRMGFRLEGAFLRHRAGADIISDATPLGVIQVPASGQPMLLMADRQTLGGYPKIATVITADLAAAGQLAPGDTVAFEVCTRREALAALIAEERALMAVEFGGRTRLDRHQS